MFDKDGFVAACREALPEGQKAIREVVREAVSEPAAITAALGEPRAAGITPLYRSDDLTVLHFVWSPYMSLFPHNHQMFAVIGLYHGREDNLFWRRRDTGIEAAGGESLGVGQAVTLGRDIIHSVTNPLGKRSCALHVYGGDFFDPPVARSEWDHETLRERPWKIEHARAVFEEAEARYEASR